MLSNFLIGSSLIVIWICLFSETKSSKCIKKEANKTLNDLLYKIDCCSNRVELVIISFEASDFIREYKRHLPRKLYTEFKAELNAAIKNKEITYLN